MEYSTAYRVQVFLTYGVGFLLVGIPAGVLLFLGLFALYNSIMNLTVFLFPRWLNKRKDQQEKTANTQKYCEYVTRRNFKHRGEPMHKQKRYREAWIIRQHVDKKFLHKPQKIDRDFFKTGKDSK